MLAETELLDSEAEPAFDRLTRLAATLLRSPTAVITLIDDRRQFLKSTFGMGEPLATERETPLSHSYCKYAVASGEPLIVRNSQQHPFLHKHPATLEYGVVAYAGVPLTANNQSLGTLCVVDDKPREWNAEELELLRELSTAVSTEIQLRLALKHLRTREAMFRALTESAHDAIISADTKGNIVFWNAAAEEMFGYPPEAVLGKPLTMLMPERYRDAHRSGIARVAAGGRPRLLGGTTEIEGLRKSGEEFPLELSLSSWSSPQGQFFTGIMRDVTARKLHSDALRRSEEQFRLTIDNAPIGMALVGLDGRFLRVNQSLCDITGYEADELVRLTFQQITHADDLPGDIALIEQLVAGEIASYHLAKRYLRRDAATVNVMTHVALVRDRNEVPQYFTVQVEDVSKKRRAEAELLHKTMILESVLNHMSDGVVVADVSGEVLLFNPAAQRMFGHRPASAYNDWAAEFGLFEADGTTPVEPAAVPMRRALRGEYVDQHDLFVLPRAGSPGSWRSVTATPLRDAQGAVWGALTVGRDITRSKESELALREQAAIIRLLEAVAVAANEAATSRRAMKDSLKLVCEFMNWPVGHVYTVDGVRLLPSDLWHLSDPERFAAFREVTSRTHLTSGLGLPGRVLATGRPAWMEDVQTDKGFLRARAANALGVHGGVAFPVTVGDEVFAVMEFYADRPAVPDARALEVMHHVGSQLGRVVERERHAEAVRNLSLTDELTELNNRRGFLALAEAQLRLAGRGGKHALLLFIDMDGLKQINDQLGHEVGDAAIAALAQVLRGTFRESDILGRLGGDEFVALLPDTPESDKGAAVHRLHEAVTLHNVQDQRNYVLSVSVGVTCFDPKQPLDIETLLSKADSLMYEQKRRRKGRPSMVFSP